MDYPDTREINYSLGRRLKLVWGTIRRYYLTHYRPRYVEEQIEEYRRGECRRCAACCKLGFRCPFLAGENHCEIYERRSIQCRKFPIDQRDLDEVPQCNFRFEPRPETLGATRPTLPGRALALVQRTLGTILPT